MCSNEVEARHYAYTRKVWPNSVRHLRSPKPTQEGVRNKAKQGEMAQLEMAQLQFQYLLAVSVCVWVCMCVCVSVCVCVCVCSHPCMCVCVLSPLRVRCPQTTTSSLLEMVWTQCRLLRIVAQVNHRVHCSSTPIILAWWRTFHYRSLSFAWHHCRLSFYLLRLLPSKVGYAITFCTDLPLATSAVWHFYKQCVINSFRQVIWLECKSNVSLILPST
jgi:hypothetical protein